MRLLMKLLAPLLGWLAYGLFRSSILKSSRLKHRLLMKLFRYAADYGSTRALSVYGHLLHYRGEGQDNRIQGAIYLRRAADQGDAKAAYQVAKLLEEGYPGMSVDFIAALKFYQQAGETGHILAIKRLVEIYRDGGLDQSADQTRLNYWQELQQRYSP